jgi:hydrogenase/urease accessory protein HupE
VRPALLQVTFDANEVCRVDWKQPTSGEVAIHLSPQFSGGWTDGEPEHEFVASDHRAARWLRHDCSSADIEKQSIVIDGLDATITDVLLRVDYGDGDILTRILHPGDPPLSLMRSKPVLNRAGAYFGLGVDHILEGADHLAFVLGLVLLVGFTGRLFLAVTGFTVAHSLTLGATALGITHPWPPLIEAFVALSIIFVASEVLRAQRGSNSLSIRWPVIAAFAFGLLHGFAFAGALAEVGLPKGETLAALLLFNLGVEAGQLLFIAAVFVISSAIGPLLPRLPRWTWRLPPYAIGGFAGFLFVVRAAALFA